MCSSEPQCPLLLCGPWEMTVDSRPGPPFPARPLRRRDLIISVPELPSSTARVTIGTRNLLWPRRRGLF